MSRKPSIIAALVVLAVVAAAAPVSAQTNASSKATAAINTVTVCANKSNAPCLSAGVAPTGVWQNVMTSTIKASNVSDLFVNVSMVTGLYTNTLVKGNGQ